MKVEVSDLGIEFSDAAGALFSGVFLVLVEFVELSSIAFGADGVEGATLSTGAGVDVTLAGLGET